MSWARGLSSQSCLDPAGEARRQPEPCTERCDDHYFLVWGRVCVWRGVPVVCGVRGVEPCLKRYDGHYYICLGRRPGAPKWAPGWCGSGRCGAGGGAAALGQGC